MQVTGEAILVGAKPIESKKGEFIAISLEVHSEGLDAEVVEFFVAGDAVPVIKKGLVGKKKNQKVNCVFDIRKRGQYPAVNLLSLG